MAHGRQSSNSYEEREKLAGDIQLDYINDHEGEPDHYAYRRLSNELLDTLLIIKLEIKKVYKGDLKKGKEKSIYLSIPLRSDCHHGAVLPIHSGLEKVESVWFERENIKDGQKNIIHEWVSKENWKKLNK